MKGVNGIILAVLALALFAGCVKKAPLSEKAVTEFYTLVSGEAGDAAVRKYYQKHIKPSLKAFNPAALERVFQYTHRTDYTAAELKGGVRLALLMDLQKAASPAAVAQALGLLMPALPKGGAGQAGLLDSLRAYTGAPRHTRLCALLAAGLMTQSLSGLEQTRPASPETAQRHLADFRFALLALPEDQSEVLDITRIVWQETFADVNEINLDRLRNILKGAYPGLFVQ
ncbi:MAG: hypothetical protein V1913_13615 [Fibrobacterota bacterium]